MRIHGIKGENFKRLKVVSITPKGDVVKISGPNEAGKTSLLDTIWAALGGASAAPEKPIRVGASKAVIQIDLGDMIVERTFNESGTTSLKVTNKEGAVFPSPQKMLDQLVGKLTFDPLDFLKMDPKKQGEVLRQLVGLNVADLDRKRQEAYQQRTLINRDVESLAAQGKAIVVPEGAPDAEVDPADLLTQLQNAQETNQQNAAVRQVVIDARTRLDGTRAAVAAAEKALADARVADRAAVEMLADAQECAVSLEDVDLAPLQARFDNLKVDNEAARAKQRRRELGRQYRAAQAQSDALTTEIADLDTEKAERLAACKFPVSGMSLNDEGLVTLNEIPIKQISGAQQLKLSVAIAMAMNPKLKVLRLADASLLDSKSWAVLEQMAAEHDFQVFCEVVDESGKVGIVIENGEVVADNQLQAAA